MSRTQRQWRWALPLAAAVVLADVLTKELVQASFACGERLVVTDFFNLVFVQNSGAACDGRDPVDIPFLEPEPERAHEPAAERGGEPNDTLSKFSPASAACWSGRRLQSLCALGLAQKCRRRATWRATHERPFAALRSAWRQIGREVEAFVRSVLRSGAGMRLAEKPNVYAFKCYRVVKHNGN